jgi:hypothetical protein
LGWGYPWRGSSGFFTTEDTESTEEQPGGVLTGFTGFFRIYRIIFEKFVLFVVEMAVGF